MFGASDQCASVGVVAMTRDWEDDAFPVARELGIGIRAVQPARSRILTGSITSLDALPAEDYRRQTPRFQGDNLDLNMQIVRRSRPLR